jgi:hypothetical protein
MYACRGKNGDNKCNCGLLLHYSTTLNPTDKKQAQAKGVMKMKENFFKSGPALSFTCQPGA